MDFEAWLDDLISTETRAIAAKKAGYAQSTISRQLGRGYLRPETVIALCRAYGRSPVTGLIETGYLHDYEVNAPAIDIALHNATNQQLLDEIMRRSDPEARTLFGADDDTIGLDPDAQVIDFPPLSEEEVDAAIQDAQELKGAAKHSDGTRYEEPDLP